MLYLLIFFGIQVVLISTIYVRYRQRYRTFIEEFSADFQLLFMAPISLWLLEQSRFVERFPMLIQKTHNSTIKIYGRQNSIQFTKMYIAQILSMWMTILLLFTGIALLANGDFIILCIGLVMNACTPLLMHQQLQKKIKRRQQEIVIDLPEFLDKIALLVGAGETLQNAIICSVDQQPSEGTGTLYIELRRVVHELQLNHSFSQILEGFNQRCAVAEVSVLTTTLLLNHRRGGEELGLALRELSREMWDKKKTIAKTLGEEASSKLVFPMILIFVVVMVIVASPAFMLMDN